MLIVLCKCDVASLHLGGFKHLSILQVPLFVRYLRRSKEASKSQFDCCIEVEIVEFVARELPSSWRRCGFRDLLQVGFVKRFSFLLVLLPLRSTGTRDSLLDRQMIESSVACKATSMGGLDCR